MSNPGMDRAEFRRMFLDMMDNQENSYHPLVWINGSPEIGAGTYIGGLSEVNAKGAHVRIGAHCDIASFVAINVSDTHKRTIGLAEEADLKDIEIGAFVFIGSHSIILGGASIGHHTVVGANTVVRKCKVPPFSLVVGSPAIIKPGYYRRAYEARHGPVADEDFA